MRRYEMICVGAGPAGLAAAVEAAKHGVQVIAFDENERPGGQLFKQIHKFFGSSEHRAKERGFNIGNSLLAEAKEVPKIAENRVIVAFMVHKKAEKPLKAEAKTQFGKEVKNVLEPI